MFFGCSSEPRSYGRLINENKEQHNGTGNPVYRIRLLPNQNDRLIRHKRTEHDFGQIFKQNKPRKPTASIRINQPAALFMWLAQKRSQNRWDAPILASPFVYKIKRKNLISKKSVPINRTRSELCRNIFLSFSLSSTHTHTPCVQFDPKPDLRLSWY